MNDISLNDKPVASSAPASFPPFFRRRTLGRAPSPPTWACYEQIPQQTSDSDEDEVQTASESGSESEAEDDGSSQHNNGNSRRQHCRSVSLCEDMEMDMDMDEPVRPSAEDGSNMAVDESATGDDGDDERNKEGHACGSSSEKCHSDGCEDEQQQVKRVDKGKQRAIDPSPSEEKEKSPKRRHRRRKHNEIVYRPILTIKKSEGFVWNQDLFIPSYIKGQYVACTSPSSNGLLSSTSPVPVNEINDTYEIEVVEIRVQGNELDGILS